MPFKTSALLLVCLATVSQATYARHHFDASMKYLSAEQQAQCISAYQSPDVPNRGKCYVFATCILQNLTDYALAGANSGTTLIALIPPTLAVFAGGRANQRSLLSSRLYNPRYQKRLSQRFEAYLLLLIAAFAGTYSPGLALDKVARSLHSDQKLPEPLGLPIEKDPLNRDGTAKTMANTGSTSKTEVESHTKPTADDSDSVRDLYLPAKSLDAGLFRFLVYVVLLSAMAGTLYVWCLIGFRSVVTWACNYDILVVIWATCRIGPLLIESLVMWILGNLLDARKRAPNNDARMSIPLVARPAQHPRSTETAANRAMPEDESGNDDGAIAEPNHGLIESSKRVSSAYIKLISIVSLAIRVADFALILLGTGILGSSILIDGAEAFYYFIGVPILYGLMNICYGILE